MKLVNSRIQEFKNSRIQEEPTVPRRGPHRSQISKDLCAMQAIRIE